MPFTGVPGSANARPGNTVPGLGGATNALSETASSTLVVTQTVHVSVTYNRISNQSLTFAQTSGQAYDKTVSATLTISDIAEDLLIGNTHINQSLTLINSATYTMSREVLASSFVMLAHEALRTQVFNRQVNQSLTLTDFSVKTIPESLPQSLTLIHVVDVVKVIRQGVVQALVLTQTNVVAITYGRAVFQGLPLTQTIAKSISRVKALTSTLALSQTAIGIASKRAANSLTLTQTALADLVHGARNVIELSQTVVGNHTTEKRLFDVLPVFQTLARSLTTRRTVPQSLTLTQSVSAYVGRTAQQTLNLTQEAIGDKVKPAFDTLELGDSAICGYNLGLVAFNRLFPSHTVLLQKATFKPGSNVLSLSQAARGKRTISRSVSHTIPLTQDLVRERFTESVSQSLVLTQTVSGPKRSPRSVSQSLAMTQTVSVAKTLNRLVTDNLVFLNSFTRYVGLPGLPIVTVPPVQVVLVRNLIILESGSFVITLPAPEWNDKEGGNGKVNIKRAMDGTRRIYKRDNPTSNLTYDLIMDRVKAIELRTFIMNCNSSLMRMTNWKGEIWYVVLSNNPFTFTEDAYWGSAWGNKCSITLEFRGVRVN